MQPTVNERSELISKLQGSRDSRASYIRGKINVLVPAQLRALRLRKGWKQERFAQEAGMRQSRVSAMEKPGAVNFNIDTLVRSAATYGVGLVVQFVPFSEMLAWENGFSQDAFNPVAISDDSAFLTPIPASFTLSTESLAAAAAITTTARRPALANLIVSRAAYEQKTPPIAALAEGVEQHGQ